MSKVLASLTLSLIIISTICGDEGDERNAKLSSVRHGAPAKAFRKMGRPSTAKVPIVTKIGAKSPKGLQIANREVPVEKILRGEDTPGIGSILFQTAGDLLTERVRLFQRSGEIISKGVENIAKSAEKAKTAKPDKASDELASNEDNEPLKHVQKKPLWPTNAWPGVDMESRHSKPLWRIPENAVHKK